MNLAQSRYLLSSFQPGRKFFSSQYIFSRQPFYWTLFHNLERLFDILSVVTRKRLPRFLHKKITITALHNYQLPIVFDKVTIGLEVYA